MYTQKSIGIWMDDDSVHLIEFRKLRVETVIIRSRIKEREKFLQPKEECSDDSHQHENFLKKISEQLRDYDEILIFGPDNAKFTFEQYLNKNPLFANKKIILQTAEKMTDNHKHAWVNKYFITSSYQKQ